MIELRRGDVVLIAFPFISQGQVERKRRPAVVVQADRYDQRRAAVIIAAITGTHLHTQLPSKVVVKKDSPAGREANLRLDSVVDCQTLATVPRTEIVSRLGRLPGEVIEQINRGLEDALGLSPPVSHV
ncbi:MAG: type II toxin-antitoxin system PemK/MazF family toxin [Armatimonadetes bacterium]|nr:type II toxin-antitoxin system PemK/MazF family toxin [Armatimonadota bacterium]